MTDIPSWFGLINQVAGYGQLRKTQNPFCPFLSPKIKFEWTDELQSAFEAGKLEIGEAIEEGMPLRRRESGLLHGRLADLPRRIKFQL